MAEGQAQKDYTGTLIRVAGNITGSVLDRYLTENNRAVSDMNDLDVQKVAFLAAQLARSVVFRVLHPPTDKSDDDTEGTA